MKTREAGQEIKKLGLLLASEVATNKNCPPCEPSRQKKQTAMVKPSLVFLNTEFRKQLCGVRTDIERKFNELRIRDLE